MSITEIQIRRDTLANWTAANPVLGQGEPALELDTKRQKIGDGVTPYNSLGYPPYLNCLNVDYTGVVEATSIINAALAAAAETYSQTGVGQWVVLGQGTVAFNVTEALSPVPAGVVLAGSGMGVAYDYPTATHTLGQFYSGTTLVDYGFASPSIHVVDTNFPGPESSLAQLGFVQQKSTGGRICDLTLFCAAPFTGGGAGLIGVWVDSIYYQVLENVRVCHYNDGTLMWNPLINFSNNQCCEFAGHQFKSKANNNLANLPPFTGTSNSSWTYIGAAPVYSTTSASMGVNVSPQTNLDVIGGGIEKCAFRNLVIQDCTRGLVVGPKGSASGSCEHNDLDVIFLQRSSASWLEVVGGITMGHSKIHLKGNSKQDVLSTSAPYIAVGQDATGCDLSKCELTVTNEINEAVGPSSGWVSTTTYSLGEVVTYSGDCCISLAAGNLNNTPPSAGSANAYWANVGAYGSPQSVYLGANATVSAWGALFLGNSPNAATFTAGSSWTFYGPVTGDLTLPTTPIPGVVTTGLSGAHTLVSGEDAIWTSGTVTATLPSLPGQARVANAGSGTITVAPPAGGTLYSLSNTTGNETLTAGTSGLFASADGVNWHRT